MLGVEQIEIFDGRRASSRIAFSSVTPMAATTTATIAPSQTRAAYVGFDRFGIEALISDDKRIESVGKMVDAGYARSVCLSHDVPRARAGPGRPIFNGHLVATPEAIAASLPNWEATHFFKRILPRLRPAGVTEADVHTIFVENPRRYFRGEEPPRQGK